MNRGAFDSAQELLAAAGLAIDETRYDAPAFGSWVVSISTAPRLRIVWDGKDGWLLVQRETSRTFSGFSEWDDLWLERRPGVQSIAEAVGHVRAIANGSP
jgi:hypothetical protein